MSGSWRSARAAAIALLWIAALPVAAASQHRLTDAELQQLPPLLEAEILYLKRVMAELAGGGGGAAGRDLEAHERLQEALHSGAVDPLEWLRERWPELPAPPRGRYDRGCSVEMYSGYQELDLGDRRAITTRLSTRVVYTFDLEAERVFHQLLRGGADLQALTSEAPDPQTPKVDALLSSLGRFLQARGFELISSSDGEYFLYMPPDRSVAAAVWRANFGPGPGCRALPSGPVLELMLAGVPSGAAGGGFQPPGLAAEKYLEIADAAEGAWVLDRSGEPIPEFLDDVYRHNVAVYRRHRARLEPLLRERAEMLGR